MRHLSRWLLTAGLVLFSASAAEAAAPADCADEDGLSFLCGAKNVEDIVAIPGTDLAIGSSMAGFAIPGGKLILIDGRRRTAREIEPDASRKPLPAYAACPGTFDPAAFQPHGVAIGGDGQGGHLLYVVNHGAREAIELFTLTAGKDAVSLHWAGCVMLPAGVSGNGVAPLPDGGFVATKYYDTTKGDAVQQLMAVRPTGGAYRWSPGKGFTQLRDSTLPGLNGVEVSADGRWIFVAGWSQDRILRYDAHRDGPPTSIALDFMPDNIRRAPDGSLLIAGQDTDPATLMGCKTPICPIGWTVARLDPASLRVDYLLRRQDSATFSAASGATELAGTLWIATPRGDRIAIAPLPASQPKR